MEENREAIILRLQVEQDDEMSLINLLTDINLTDEDSESLSEEYSSEEDSTHPSSIEATLEQLKILTQMGAIRRADSSENEFTFS